MKEFTDLHERILARVGDDLPETGISLTRDEEVEGWEMLPADLQAEVVSLRETLESLVPDDFDYYVILGMADTGARFGLERGEAPAGSQDDGTFDPARSLFDQLRLLDWEERREAADRNGLILADFAHGMERILTPLPPAKQYQRIFREEMKDFIKEKRRDAARVHVMYWRETDALTEVDFPDGEALRAALPDLVGEGAEIVTIVANGKPLPVERIDALKATAIQIFGDRPMRPRPEAEENVIDIEAETIESEPHPPDDKSSSG